MAGIACALLLAGCAATAPPRATPASSPSPPPGVGTVLDGAVPADLLALPLVDQRGHRTTLGALKGRVVVVSDMMTLCQEICAIGTASMLQAARALDRAGLGDKVRFLSITIDPKRDDRRHLAAYWRQFGSLRNWDTLGGSPAHVDRLWDRLGVWRRTVRVRAPYPRDWLTGRPLTSDIQHTDDLVFIDARQRFRFLIDGAGSVPSPGAIPARIYGFMNAQGHRNARSPSAGSWSAARVRQVVQWLVDNEGATP
ncbi:MAG: SCO family protein [Oryzihumus sp.]